ncbi:hypothetical protein CCAL9344_07785 [Campylobacter sp. RM9344]|uniref:Uncharacterized protein n=1 Tax=Campylobacter californiensis TaxID=1032243 RepID=A0AAW3ZTF3_9BACT|nr:MULTISPECIES: hypothetical protein [unclassified Campylobacter]MBE2983999.1 hypothetical protein [Campylobacter sp. RM6883]MBE2994537.1 hypothetical protein [Campylobacter sp. RM6913]MBE3030078.1 hypothetical protein [Campylobacter sp. RM9344]MBE3607734.1 hypothetical protein [Campylobacter sp. RM9337]QCD51126.1 hypothetical protein CCAL_1226 [Campylobacter sp. RM6914]
MTFSFITPEPRPILSLFSKLWLTLIGSVFFVLLLVNLLIIYKNYSLATNTKDLFAEQTSLSEKIVHADEVWATLTTRISAATDIYTSNTLLKKSLHNLFDIVPDSITLEEVLMQKNSLIIRGTTPTKDVFNQLLATPLKSIFSTSNTSFYQTKNGWYGFISTNKIDNSEGYNE